jgi:ADP-heptose:LPS heptosyltransferase/glycosyltransferase involved in cell wall biosynthesis/SAM-dependent methyltransferase
MSIRPMRILVSNPDTIGDLVLRQPLFNALLREGHELTLIVRASVAALIPYVAPGAKQIVLPEEVYRDDLPAHWDQFAQTFAAARAVAPDMLVIAPFQWTLFEEKLAEELPGARRIGMNGRLYRGDPHAGRSRESKLWFDNVAAVNEDQPEVEKNAALAAVVLGHPVQLGRPKLSPDQSSLERATANLGQLGLAPNQFWIAAVAGARHVQLKQWDPQGWGKVLGHWSAKFGRRFLFVGLPEERPTIETVRSAMGEQADHGVMPVDEQASLDHLIAMTALAAGYVGHDTGPMHLAAALGKPALAVFGGGTWPRFVPDVEPSCSIMVGVPCTGCGWVCGFAKPHCIQDVPVAQVMQAVEDMEAAKITGREMRVIPASGTLQGQMIREAAEIVRQQQRETAEIIRQLHESRATEAEQRRMAEEQTKLAADGAKRAEETNALVRGFQIRVGELEVRHAQELSNVVAGVSSQFAATLEAERLTHARQLEGLATRLGHIEGRLGPPKPVKPPREHWKVRAAKWISGKTHYVPLLGFRKLPKISIVTPVRNGQDWLRETIESVLGQNYPNLEYIVVDGGSTDDTPKIIEEYRDRIDRIIFEPDEGMYDAIAKGFESATGEVFGYLNSDDLLEPGGLMRVGEYFRNHRRAKVIYHEDTVTRDGWRFPNFAQPRVDVYQLLNGHTLYQDGVFFRKEAYRTVHGIDRKLKRAGDWDLFVRLARMWGLRRAPGHVSSFRVRQGQISEDRAAYNAEREVARQKFMARFGLPGRLRCRAIQAVNLLRNAAERVFRRRPMFWRADYHGKPYPPGIAPPLVPGKPISPLTLRAPDRLLFSTRDTRFGDPRIHYVYYESATGMAMAYPPMSQQELTDLYERHYSKPLKEVIPPDPNFHSPYRNFRGGNIVARNLRRIPTPWWWFNTITYGDDTAADVLRALRGSVSTEDAGIRFLDVGCFEGDLLDKLKLQTKWKLFGLEANTTAASAAQAKGHHIWQATAEDAAVVIPEGVAFDVIFLGQTIEHLEDPLIALNRLRLLLAPGGVIVVGTPNLDSKQVEFFGPTWAHWHMPYHRTIVRRRALRQMAQLAGMKVERLRTRTHPYWSTMSVQLNRLGLGAAVPHTALFPNMIAMHGTRLCGWCRLLWDWRGRGDYIIAVLRPV